MACYLSTSCFGVSHLSDAIKQCRKLSGDKIEISAPHYFQPIKEFTNVINDFREDGCSFLLHNYFPCPRTPFVLNIASSKKIQQQRARRLVERALAVCDQIEAPLYGIHAGYLADANEGSDGMFQFEDEMKSYSEALNNAVRFVNNISPQFEKFGVKFLIENLFPTRHRNISLFCTIEQIREFISQVPKSIGLILDLGHMNISSNILEFDRMLFMEMFLEEFGDRLSEVHISENNGIEDDHLPVRIGSWQLDAIKLIEKAIKHPQERKFYCLESRNASFMDIKKSIELINEIIS